MTNLIEQLSTSGKRTRTHDAQLVIKLPARAKRLVSDISDKENCSEAAIIRLALAEYFERRGYRA